MATAHAPGHSVAAWPVAASAAGVGLLLVLDVVVGESYLGLNPPALVLGLVVGAAVVAAPRALLPALLAAAATSVAISVLVAAADPTGIRPRLGRGGWPGMAETGGFLLLLCWALRALAPVQAVAAAVAVAGALAAVVDLRQDTRFGELLAVILGLGYAVAAGIGLYLRWIDADRRRDLDAARQDERLAIARELHDVVAHYVTGIVVQAQAAQAVWVERPDAARDALGQIEAAGAEALGSMRRLVGTLRGSETGPLAPAATLDDLADLAARSTALGLPARLRVDGVPQHLPPELALSVHRIVAEALTNAQRHAAGASGVDITVAAADGKLAVEVVDDGRPRPPRTGQPGFGLAGMAERAAALGGRFAAGPGPDGGWRIEAVLPLGGPA